MSETTLEPIIPATQEPHTVEPSTPPQETMPPEDPWNKIVTPIHPSEPQQVQPPPPPPPPHDILDQPLDKVTIKDVLEAQARLKAPVPQAEKQQEEPPSNEPVQYEPEDDETILTKIANNLKAANPYLDDDTIKEISAAQLQLLKPMVESNITLHNKLAKLEHSIQAILDERQAQEDYADALKVQNQMKVIHKDFEQYDPVMEQFYQANVDLLEQRYQYSQLSRPAKAELLYGIVKGLVTSGQIAPQNFPQPQPQTQQPPRQGFARTSTLPPVSAGTVPNPQPRKVDQLMGDVFKLMGE